jgi:hypothetical protein
MAGAGRQHQCNTTRRPNSQRKDFFQQDSPFLRLPAEIRNHIYLYSLSKYDGAIDLWPQSKIIAVEASEDPRNAQLQERARRLLSRSDPYKTADDDDEPLCFRHQRDLKYVRKNLAVGLLATCQQVYQEAFWYLYGNNTFRFSEDEYFIGIRRFMTSIGPRARREWRCLQLPTNCWTLDNGQYISSLAPNHPKLQMNKLYFKQAIDDYYTPYWEREISEETNVTFVANIFRTELRDTLQELQFIVPPGNGFEARLKSSWKDENYDASDVDLVYESNIDIHLQNTPWLRKVIVVERGGVFRSEELRKGAVFEDCGLLMRAGSINNLNFFEDLETFNNQEFKAMKWSAEAVVMQPQRHEEVCWFFTQDQYFTPSNKYTEEDTSYGIQEIFELNEVSVTARGGRTTRGLRRNSSKS